MWMLNQCHLQFSVVNINTVIHIVHCANGFNYNDMMVKYIYTAT